MCVWAGVVFKQTFIYSPFSCVPVCVCVCVSVCVCVCEYVRKFYLEMIKAWEELEGCRNFEENNNKYF